MDKQKDIAEEILFEIKPTSKVSLGIKELIQFYELFYYFTWRDIKVKYKQTVLGFLWAVLQPFIMMIVFTVFFSSALKIDSGSLPYPIFVYSGLLLWNVFSGGLNAAANSMINNSGIIKKIYFPRLIIPMSSILVSLFDFLMALLIYVVLIFYFKQEVSLWAFLYIPLSVLITVVATFGLGCWLAALSIKYRDFRYVIPFGIQILMFVSPVIYPTSQIPYQWIQKILIINPMNASISLFRASFSGVLPEIGILIYGGLTALFLLVFGLYYFRKTEHYFADLA